MPICRNAQQYQAALRHRVNLFKVARRFAGHICFQSPGRSGDPGAPELRTWNLGLHKRAFRVTKDFSMDRDQLRAMQAPVKQRYLSDPTAALVTLRAEGTLGENATCSIATNRAQIATGLHTAAGGTDLTACSGDMLLQALVACAGVTVGAVATALGVGLRGGTVTAEGDIDFRGTLAVAKDVPVGFKEIRLLISLNTDASSSLREKLLTLTERYCVVYQTLLNGAKITMSL